MRIAPILKRVRTLRNLCYVRNYRAARTITELCLDRRAYVYDRATNSYYIRDLNLRLVAAHHDLLPVLWMAFALKQAGVSFSNSGDDIIADTGSFKVVVGNEDELFILYEVIAQGVYNVVSSSESVVVDIGMNVGMASLYFAAQPWVSAVWAYEPVPETYARASVNFERNPALATKIIRHNYGLSDAAGEVTFEFCPRWRGATGVYGLPPEFLSFHRVNKEEISRITVQVQSVSDAVRQLRAAHPHVEALVKLDCEGAEYAILKELRRAGLLCDIAGFFVEWHERGPRELEQVLAGAGFFVLSLTPHATSTGMVYAHRTGVLT